jgi:hypothetical protein
MMELVQLVMDNLAQKRNRYDVAYPGSDNTVFSSPGQGIRHT